jgi:Xaa-Pro aminopeptidase
MIKTDEEIKVFRMACAAVEVGFTHALEAVKAGIRECEILGEAMRSLYALGMEIPQCSLIVASGEQLAPLARFASDRIVRHGDLVFMDLGGCFNGMFAEYTRTVACSTASDEQRHIAETVYQAMADIVAAVGPGVTGARIQEIAAEAYRRGGLGDFGLKTVLGHGIGVAGWEPPTLGDPSVTGSNFELQPNMVLSVEPTIVVPGVRGGGGIRLEDEILITADGCEVLTRTPLDTKLFPGASLPSKRQ